MASAPVQRPWLPVVVTAAVLLTLIGVCVGYPCFATGIRYGLWLDKCPASDLRLAASVSVDGLIRGDKGYVTVTPTALYLLDDGPHASPHRSNFTRGAGITLTLTDADGKPVEDVKVDRFKRSGNALRAYVTLPDLPDGDYVVKVDIDTAFEDASIEVPLPLYAPALAHVVSDRPLYKPGQEVLLRSVLLKRTDMSPLDGRPGRWRILAPDGTEMHTERSKAGAFGISHTSFPLDRRAEQGKWTAIFESGGSSDKVQFDVKPFKLPRFTVELEPSRTWFSSGDVLGIEGVARYASGAPVAEAPVTLTLARASGRWPMPLDWEEPVQTVTGRDGRFQVEFGEVPSDLIELAELTAFAQVTEAAGEIGQAGAKVVLSQDDLKVEAVTELGDGLVEGFNNRAYIRVLRPDGTPIPLADISVENPWDPKAPKRDAKTDEDGVAALQLDPGPPVTVVIPAPPIRVRPLEPAAVQLNNASEMGSSRSLDLPERRALDALHPEIARCGDFAQGGVTSSVAVKVAPSGAIQRIAASDSPVDRCVASVMQRLRMPASSGPRTYRFDWYVPDSLRPTISVNSGGSWGSDYGLFSKMNTAAIEARRCVERGQGVSSSLFELHWGVRKGSTAVDLDFVSRSGTGLGPGAVSCIRSKLANIRLDDPAGADGMGGGSVYLNVPLPPGTSKPQPTTTMGYELKVAALGDDEGGETRLILPVGTIPNLRLRATPSLAKPGEQVEIEMLRGPSWRGDLPKKLWLSKGNRSLEDEEADGNKVVFTIPSDAEGFHHVSYSNARAVIYVTPAKPLALSLSTEQPAYRPGENAELLVKTTAGGEGTPAAVGLMGVDSTLGQLAPLTGPDDWGRITVRATSDNPAFGSFDPRALTLGRVRGENAAKAAVLRISQLPMDEAGDQRTYGNSSKEPDTQGVLVTNFYGAYEVLIRKVRAWEKSAADGETMQPPIMAKLWAEALAERKSAGEPAVDGWGRELTLDLLPNDLLEQLDPRQLVADGTRLPEDIVSWTGWVDAEVR